MRSGSRDYFPVVGKVIDSEYMLSRYPKIKRGLKRFEFKYINNLYVLNGLGGRGFVLAPLLSKWLIEHIIDGSAIDKRVEPDRLFLKWARRLK
jgi:tRNA 5-methylaminomethyl-2-thiouridine biosynthesis bifunctional protein